MLCTLALRRRGWDATCFERTRSSATDFEKLIGIQLWPFALAALRDIDERGTTGLCAVCP